MTGVVLIDLKTADSFELAATILHSYWLYLYSYRIYSSLYDELSHCDTEESYRIFTNILTDPIVTNHPPAGY